MSYMEKYDPNQAKQQSDADKAEASEYIKGFEMKAAARTMWESHWQECMDYIVPRKADVTSHQTPGGKRGNELFDSTAILANNLLAGALHGMLTNPQVKFFELKAEDKALNDDESVREWLQIVSDRMFDVLNNSNFQTELHEIYVDLGAIGTSCLYIGEHPERVVHFSARPIKEIFIDENSEGLVDCVDRLFKWKAKQIVQEFGAENCSREILQKYNECANDDFDVLHSTHPVSDLEYEKRGKIFRYKSVYMLKEQGWILSRKNFHEFPYAVPRWSKSSGEVYGRGPGMDTLPEIKMINKMKETTLKGAQKTVDPPLMVDDDGVIGNVRLTPGGLTVVRPGMTQPIRPLITDARVDFGMQMIESVSRAILSGFYVDQLQLPPDTPQMTAAEVSTRSNDKFRLMGPVLGRQHFESLRPTIGRVFGICSRKGVFPPAPAKLAGKNIGVEYSSLLARAQKMQEGETIMRAMGTVAGLVQVLPNTIDNINGDRTFRHIMKVYGVPETVFNKTQEVEGIRKQRAQAQQEAMEAAKEAQAADNQSKIMSAGAQVAAAQPKEQ